MILKNTLSTLTFSFTFALLCLFAVQSQAQGFHRNYPPENANEKITVLDAKGLNNGNTIALFKNIITTPDTVTTHVVISLFDMKGKVEGSIQYDIADAIDGQLVLTEQDTFYAVISTDRGLYTVGWSFANLVNPVVRNMHRTSDIFDGLNYSTSFFENTYYLGSPAKNLDSSFISISKYNDRFEPLWYKNFTVQDSFGTTELGALSATLDTTLVITGTLSDTSLFVVTANVEGDIFQAFRLYDTLSVIKEIFVTSQAAMPDSSVVVVGNWISKLGEKSGFIASINKIGQVEWSKSVVIPGSTETHLEKVIGDWDSGVIIAGLHLTDSLYPLSLKLSRTGNPVWQKQYNRMPGEIMSALFNTSDKAAGIFYQDTLTQRHRPSFVKMDTNGSTTCEEDITGNLYQDLTWVSDTLIWEIKEFDVSFERIDTIKVKSHQYKVPTTNLEIATYCPDEPVNHLFDPKLTNANPANVTYLWSTGATTDTLRVFDKEEYTLITTINEEVCFTLCDTVKILEFGPPSISLQLVNNRFCTEGVLEIRGSFLAEAGDKSITWSTGETNVRSITITQIGDYTVTYIDNCDQEVSRTLAVTQWPKRVENVTITPEVTVNCFNGISGRLVANGDAILLDQTYRWSTGATGSILNLNNFVENVYSVTVTDQCGDTAETTITIDLTGPGITTATINAFPQGDCDEITWNLNVTANQNGNFTYSWTTGATTPNINVSGPGTYTVTVTDLCGNTATASRSLNASDFEPVRPTVEIEKIVNEDNICDKSVTLNTTTNRSVIYNWSNNSETSSITITEFGIFSVTVTDVCGNTATANVEIPSEDLLPPDLKYAHVFFPDGMTNPGATTMPGDSLARTRLVYNRTFGPVLSTESAGEFCFNLIQDYEFYVFNRWGQKVFEARNINDEWDGTHSGRAAAGDTYTWVVRYSILGEKKLLKGDITMIRR